jgi:hypothetical protein
LPSKVRPLFLYFLPPLISFSRAVSYTALKLDRFNVKLGHACGVDPKRAFGLAQGGFLSFFVDDLVLDKRSFGDDITSWLRHYHSTCILGTRDPYLRGLALIFDVSFLLSRRLLFLPPPNFASMAYKMVEEAYADFNSRFAFQHGKVTPFEILVRRIGISLKTKDQASLETFFHHAGVVFSVLTKGGHRWQIDKLEGVHRDAYGLPEDNNPFQNLFDRCSMAKAGIPTLFDSLNTGTQNSLGHYSVFEQAPDNDTEILPFDTLRRYSKACWSRRQEALAAEAKKVMLPTAVVKKARDLSMYRGSTIGEGKLRKG